MKLLQKLINKQTLLGTMGQMPLPPDWKKLAKEDAFWRFVEQK